MIQFRVRRHATTGLLLFTFLAQLSCAHAPVAEEVQTKDEVAQEEEPTTPEETELAAPEAAVAPDSAPEPVVQVPTETREEAWFKSATLEEKIGQMFIFGFTGLTIDDGLKDTITKYHPGALIVFGRNIKRPSQIVNLLHNAQATSVASTHLPLLIAVDQEGGNVIRLKTSPPLPSALALGETGDKKLVYRAGLYTGQLLKTIGFNMNLAPVLDLADPDRDPFLGTRTFGKNALLASQMGASFSQGLSDADVMPTAKHFPGHGGVSDSHKSTPVKHSTLAKLQGYDIQPFEAGFKELPLSAVMLAHISYPLVDPSGVPATFSKPIVTDLLRNKLKFGGLIMTDDIEMAGAFAVKNPNERAVRAIEAGADLVMIAWNKKIQAGAIKAVVAAVRSGRISQERIEQSVQRVLRAKNKFASGNYETMSTSEQVLHALRSPEMRALASETLHKRFAAVRAQTPAARGPASEAGPVFIFAASPRFYSGFKGVVPARTVRFYQLSGKQTFDMNRVMRANPDATAVLHVTGVQSAKFANRLGPDVARRVMIVNSETRTLIPNPSRYKNVIDVHFKHPDLGKLTGEYFFSLTPVASHSSSTINN